MSGRIYIINHIIQNLAETQVPTGGVGGQLEASDATRIQKHTHGALVSWASVTQVTDSLVKAVKDKMEGNKWWVHQSQINLWLTFVINYAVATMSRLGQQTIIFAIVWSVQYLSMNRLLDNLRIIILLLKEQRIEPYLRRKTLLA